MVSVGISQFFFKYLNKTSNILNIFRTKDETNVYIIIIKNKSSLCVKFLYIIFKSHLSQIQKTIQWILFRIEIQIGSGGLTNHHFILLFKFDDFLQPIPRLNTKVKKYIWTCTHCSLWGWLKASRAEGWKKENLYWFH